LSAELAEVLSSFQHVSWGESSTHFLLKILSLMKLWKSGFRCFSFERELMGLRPDILGMRRFNQVVEVAWVECGGMNKSWREVKAVGGKLAREVTRRAKLKCRVVYIWAVSSRVCAPEGIQVWFFPEHLLSLAASILSWV